MWLKILQEKNDDTRMGSGFRHVDMSLYMVL